MKNLIKITHLLNYNVNISKEIHEKQKSLIR